MAFGDLVKDRAGIEKLLSRGWTLLHVSGAAFYAKQDGKPADDGFHLLILTEDTATGMPVERRSFVSCSAIQGGTQAILKEVQEYMKTPCSFAYYAGKYVIIEGTGQSSGLVRCYARGIEGLILSPFVLTNPKNGRLGWSDGEQFVCKNEITKIVVPAGKNPKGYIDKMIKAYNARLERAAAQKKLKPAVSRRQEPPARS